MTAPRFRAPTVRTFARAAWRRWFLDRSAEFWLGELRASWSLTELRARVTRIVDETADTKTFVLAVPRSWPGHRAGQYVPVEVEIGGIRKRRCYSISSGASQPGAGRIAITVRRITNGAVSTWLHKALAVGDLVRLGAPAGDFVVDDPARPLLLVGGGSGITPIMAIVRDHARGRAPDRARDPASDHTPDPGARDVVVVHAARDDADAIFGAELAARAAALPGLRVVAHRGPLDGGTLRRYAPDLAARETYVCGPPGLVDVVTDVVGEGVHVERFVARPLVHPPPAAAATPQAGAMPRLVRLGQRGTTHAVGGGTLLEELERAGERPAHGCRMGICNSCRCTKTSGTVEDLATGQVSAEPDQEIRLCVSIARSDLELAL